MAKEIVVWVKELFTFMDEGEDFALAAGDRAQRNIRSHCQTSDEQDKFHTTLKLMRSKEGLKKLKRKKLKQTYTEPKSKMKNAIYQCRTSDNTGRIWFIMKDEEPGAIAPTLVIQGCELRSHARNTVRIKNIAKALGFNDSATLHETIEESEDEELVINPGRSIELESDFDIRPLKNALLEDIFDFWASRMGVRPTNEQLDTILGEKVKPPIFINGQAGTGKTIMLTLRAALMHLEANREHFVSGVDKPRRTLVTSISEKVVEIIEEDVRQCLYDVFRPEKVGQLVGGNNPKRSGGKILTNARDTFDLSTQKGNKETWQTSPDIREFICFRTFRDIELDILKKDARIRFEEPSNNVKFSRFSNDFFSKRRNQYGKLSPELAWFGIRTLIRGMVVAESQSRFLNRDEIDSIINENPNLLRDFHDNPSLVDSLIKCHDNYKDWMDENGLYDDLDLAKEARMELNAPNSGNSDAESRISQFDEIYLDEAQDLTEIELRILLDLLQLRADSTDVIMAGDPLQTINPSGFSWDGLRSMIFRTLKNVAEENIDIATGEKKALWQRKLNQISLPEEMNLSNNFRTPSNIVELSNIILQKRTHFHRETSADQKSSRVDGELKLLVIDSEHHAEWVTKLLTQEADRFVISGFSDKEGVDYFIEQDPLFEADSEESMIRSITQVKGLEAHDVFLYRMGESLTHRDVNMILDGATRDQLSPVQRLKVAFELNKLYIALTRSERSIYLFENSRAAELLWRGEWFDGIEIDVIDDIEKVQSFLEQSWSYAEEHTDHAKMADGLLEEFVQDADEQKLRWARKHARRAVDYPPRKLAEISANISHCEARELPKGPERNAKNLEAVDLYRQAGNPRAAYNLVLDHLMETTNGPEKAYEIVSDRPGLSRPSGDPEVDLETRFLKLLRSKGNRNAIETHISDLKNPPGWYVRHLHSNFLSGGLKSLLDISGSNNNGWDHVPPAPDVPAPAKALAKYVKLIVDANVLTRNLREAWLQDLLPLIGPSEMWDALTDQLSGYVSESKSLSSALSTCAEERLTSSKELNARMEIYETWSSLNSGIADSLAERAIKDMLKTEFESFTPSQLTRSNRWPFTLVHNKHIHILDWADDEGFKPRGRAVKLLRNIGSNNTGWPQMNLAKLSGLQDCLESDRTELDNHIPAEATEIIHLTKHLRSLGERWIVRQSKDAYQKLHEQRPTDRLLGLPYTDLWVACCENRNTMSNLLWILFDSNTHSGNSNFCNKMVNSYNLGNKGDSSKSSEGWAHFKIRFERYARSLIAQTSISNNLLAETLCEKGNLAEEFSNSKDIHEKYRAFAKAYLKYMQYQHERVQKSPEEIRTLAVRFEELGYAKYADKLQSNLPTDLSHDIPSIIDLSLPAKDKIGKILSKLNSAKRVNKAELKSNFIKFILDSNLLRNTLIENLEYFKSELVSFTNRINIANNDDAILQYFKLSLFEFLFGIGTGKIDLNDPTHQMKPFIREELRNRMSSFKNSAPAYGDAWTKLTEELWWDGGVTMFKSAALLEIFRITELPLHTPGYLTIDGLVKLRQNIGQDVANASAARPVHIRAIIGEFDGDKLFEIENLLNLSLKK